MGKYKDKIVTEDVILTDERISHIKEHHSGDSKWILQHIKQVIRKPQEILEDSKNKDTIFLIGKLETNHLNIVVKLNTTNNENHPQNSIMKTWIIREKNILLFTKLNKNAIIIIQ